MNHTQGTPKTLREAVSNGLSSYRPDSSGRMDEHVELHIKDFLAQKFGAAMIEASTEENEIELKRLYLALTRRG